jgi:hypothetical protein
VIYLNRNQIRLLKELAAAGRHGRIRGAVASSIEIARLIEAQYVKRLPHTKLYVITPLGRRPLELMATSGGECPSVPTDGSISPMEVPTSAALTRWIRFPQYILL